MKLKATKLKSMHWKFNHSELDALQKIIEAGLASPWSNQTYDKLLQVILTRLNKKLLKMMIDAKPKYKIKMDEEESLAFFECFSTHTLPDHSYEGNFINKLIACIDQQFSVTTSNQLTNINNQKLIQ